jgi:hypothetical protein
MKSRTFLAAVLASAVLVSGCGDGSSTEPDPAHDLTGTYTLVAINGEALPAAFVDWLTYRQELRSGSLQLGADGRFTWTYNISAYWGDEWAGTVTERERGGYTTSGRTVQLAFDATDETIIEANPVTATLDGREIAVTLGLRWRFGGGEIERRTHTLLFRSE